MVESQLVRTMTDPNMGSAWAGFLLPALQEEVGSGHSLHQSLGLDVWPSAALAAGHTSCSGSVWVTGAGASYQPDCCSGRDGLVSISWSLCGPSRRPGGDCPAGCDGTRAPGGSVRPPQSRGSSCFLRSLRHWGLYPKPWSPHPQNGDLDCLLSFVVILQVLSEIASCYLPAEL